MGTGVRPLLLGYQRIRIGTNERDAVRVRRELKAFAQREGFTLGEIFVDRNENRPFSALAALVVLARRLGAASIAVNGLDDLALDAAAAKAMRTRVEREAQVPVLVAGGPQRVVVWAGGRR